MTGFGRAKKEENNRIYTIEIKSVNHKYTDISVRVPRHLSYLEEKFKKTYTEVKLIYLLLLKTIVMK